LVYETKNWTKLTAEFVKFKGMEFWICTNEAKHILVLQPIYLYNNSNTNLNATKHGSSTLGESKSKRNPNHEYI
jgi:hypothetical protein